jgi:hypothetical protein
LSKNAGPVDGVNGTEAMGSIEGSIGKEGFDDILAVVEGTFHCDIVYVGIRYGSHLCLLDRRDSTLGVENEDGHILLVAEAIDSSTTIPVRDLDRT